MPGKSDCQVKPGYLSRLEPVNLNLTKCQLKPRLEPENLAVIIRFESEKMYVQVENKNMLLRKDFITQYLAYLYIYSGLLKYCDLQKLFCSLSNWVLKLTKIFLNFILERSMSKIVETKNKSHH